MQTLSDYVVRQPAVDLIVAKINIIRGDGSVIRTEGEEWKWSKFRRYMNIDHPGALHSRRLFTRYGEFDHTYKIAGDYEFLLRAGESLRTAFVNSVVLNMHEGGISQTSPRVFHEVYKAKLRHKAVPPLINIMALVKCSAWYVIKKILG